MSVFVKIYEDHKAWTQLRKRLDDIGSRRVEVGVFDGELATIAATHEYGSKDGHIPERSFLRRTFIENVKETAAMMEKLAVAAHKLSIPTARVLDMLGEWAAAQVKKRITTGEPIPPPNAPSTIRRKGSARPLVDTGRMVGSITFRITVK